MKQKNIKFGSVLTGIFLGAFIGYCASILLPFNGSLPVFIISGIFIFGGLGLLYQKTTEVITYTISIFVFFQFIYNQLTNSNNDVSIMLFYGAIILILVNAFSGHYGFKKPDGFKRPKKIK